MRHALMIAAVALLASTSAGLARTGHVSHPGQVSPGYAETQTETVPNQGNWLAIENYLDPCHCDGGAP